MYSKTVEHKLFVAVRLRVGPVFTDTTAFPPPRKHCEKQTTNKPFKYLLGKQKLFMKSHLVFYLIMAEHTHTVSAPETDLTTTLSTPECSHCVISDAPGRAQSWRAASLSEELTLGLLGDEKDEKGVKKGISLLQYKCYILYPSDFCPLLSSLCSDCREIPLADVLTLDQTSLMGSQATSLPIA